MKSFKEYLTESKKTYHFKVKIAGHEGKDATNRMKEALAQFDPVKISFTGLIARIGTLDHHPFQTFCHFLREIIDQFLRRFDRIFWCDLNCI